MMMATYQKYVVYLYNKAKIEQEIRDRFCGLVVRVPGS
jgi:hypothetical protein